MADDKGYSAVNHLDNTRPGSSPRPAIPALLTAVFLVLVATALMVVAAFALNPQWTGGNTWPGPGKASAASTEHTAIPVPVPSVQPPFTAAQSISGSPPLTAGVIPAPVPVPERNNTPTASSVPVASAPIRFSIAAAGVDIPVLPLTPTGAGQPIEPPLTLDGYWLTSFGKPGKGSVNTTYIIGHSWEGLNAPFNQLSTRVQIGDLIKVTTGTGTMMYIVDSITTHDKTTLQDADIWRIVPDRLVIISCYTRDLWGQNLIVTASPEPRP
ncbi:class F sortase (plasmid) [Pseudarthrobacter sp. P1]|uniref:class F sortase n=1 Tax=Pseudarthrobacter sp. P1 TaxID=3418418 RepID=UPI003CEB8D54